MADPIKIIKSDHRMVEKLFKGYEQLSGDALRAKQKIAEDICVALTLHAEMEETIMYPKQEEKFNNEGDKMVEEAYAEHEVVKGLIATLEEMDPDDPQFDAKLKVLQEVVSHHVKEEEQELLPKTEKEFSEEELSEMGDEMEAFKAENN